ncbi:hypothetical protein [Chromohalobacter nigrandesensis]|uniref:hypothetical protein n=1 Tax=Chromohalobacter nigrandesensis TaxID=119863 RepID=UPI001FF1688A|nr:hypothetical protein [Chromohalobacter nigrandesensis]MCK0743942.1 hypothetical protein [Chromohalobacter nigrandesensis]
MANNIVLDATATAYKLGGMGYKKGRNFEPGFPGPFEIVASLIKWGGETSCIENTFTYKPGLGRTPRNTYFADGYFDQASNEAVLVLWKEVNSNRGDIYGLPRGNEPGVTSGVETQNFDIDKLIPGFPVYFWFRFDDLKMISLEFDHSDRGKGNLVSYIEGFLRSRSDCVVSKFKAITEGNVEHSVKGYSPDGTFEKIVENITPKVYLGIEKSGLVLDKLLEKKEDITRLRRIEKFYMTSDAGEKQSFGERYKENHASGRGIFRSLLESPRKISTVRYKSEISWKPTEDELREIHSNVAEAHENGELENFSAILKDGSSISFLGNAVRNDVEIELQADFKGYINASSLHAALDSSRENLP